MSIVGEIGGVSVWDRRFGVVDDEVDSNFEYPPEYDPAAADIRRQVALLQRYFGGLGGPDPDYLKAVLSGSVKKPELAEKFVALPDWRKRPEIFGATYNHALEKADRALLRARKGAFCSYCDDLGPQYIHESARSRGAWEKIAKDQGDPSVLLVPIQFGLLHRGRSVRVVRLACAESEFGLGTFAAMVLLATHPKRLRYKSDLAIECPGDEVDDSESDRSFDFVTYFKVEEKGRLLFGAAPHNGISANFGSVTGFIQ